MSALPLCVKTPKGVDEVERRSFGLQMRSRQVLIMIDGKRDYETLSAMFPGNGLRAIVEALRDDGFITPLQRPTEMPAAVQRPSAPAPASEVERFAMARNFMINTTAAFVGVAGSSLANKLDSCADLASLRHNFNPWRDAIRLSRDGRKQIGELEDKLAALLS